jgi:xanthine/CO dehydrogenase XdhC/CoxF family maturation factor
VAVWGASAAGVVAAIAACRAGAAAVVLLSPTAHVGGLTTSGLGCVDAGNSSGLGGVAREFYENVARALDANATGAAWRLTPGAAERVLRDPRAFCRTLEGAPHRWVLVTTHEHALDQDLVELLLPRDFAWLGLIGSKTKVTRFSLRLRAFLPFLVASAASAASRAARSNSN